MLVATNKQTSRVIWEPNPQLKDIELAQASVYTWKDMVTSSFVSLLRSIHLRIGRIVEEVVTLSAAKEQRINQRDPAALTIASKPCCYRSSPPRCSPRQKQCPWVLFPP